MIAIKVKVKPNSRHSSIVQQADGSWHATVKAPPVDGKANNELIEMVAQQFCVSKSQVTIRLGSLGRMKLLHIES